MSKGNTVTIYSKRYRVSIQLLTLFKNLVSFFLHPINEYDLGSSSGVLEPVLRERIEIKGRIDPARNFLLKRSTLVCVKRKEENSYSLYKTNKGILISLTHSENELVNDKINKISRHEAENLFGVRIH